MKLSLLLTLGVLLSLCTALCSYLFLRRREQERHLASLFYKILTAMSFCGVGLLHALWQDTPWGYGIFLGLVMGLLGDFLLGLRKVVSKDPRIFFILGMLAFSLGHGFYVGALLKLTDFHSLGIFILFLLLMVCAEMFFRNYQVKDRKVHAAGLLYVAIEAFMSAVALLLAYKHTSLGALLFATGSLSFYASDNLLIVYSFGSLRQKEVDQALHVTYLGAQLFIAWSIFFL